MTTELIAREKERTLLLELYERNSFELVSITGRRRVGKTFLINHTLEGKIDFHLTGTQGGNRKEQLANFGRSLFRFSKGKIKQKTFKDWQEAFFALEDYLGSLEKREKIVVFFDELPWLATHKSGFLSAFSYFWNSWAEQQNIMVIICGSAASWMINKVVRNRGGLHNRITKRIHLAPFNLRETKQYLESYGFYYSDYDIAELYMTLGGIPFYLKELSPNLSVTENLDAVAFDEQGVLADEFNRLYPALFDNAERHISIIRTLSKHHYGMTRQQIIAASGLPDGGRLTKTLEELEFSGFILGGYMYGKKKRYKRYRLIDEYSNFYLKFIETKRYEGPGVWQGISQQQAYKIWRGYAFENLGLRHYQQIKKALGIAGVLTTSSSFYHHGDEDTPGLQVDLLIERADRAINLCEFKFYNRAIALTKQQLDRLRARKQSFVALTQTTHTIFTSLISPYGINEKSNRAGVVNQSIQLSDFFEKA